MNENWDREHLPNWQAEKTRMDAADPAGLLSEITAAESIAPCRVCGRDAGDIIKYPTAPGIDPLNYHICPICQGQALALAAVDLLALHDLERLESKLVAASWRVSAFALAARQRAAARIRTAETPQTQLNLFTGGA